MRKFLAGAAILALIATAAPAKPGGGGGGGGNPHAGGQPGQGGGDGDRGHGNGGGGGPKGGNDERGGGRGGGREMRGPDRAETQGRGQERPRFEAPVRGPEREARTNGNGRGNDRGQEIFRARDQARERNAERRDDRIERARIEPARGFDNARADRAVVNATRFDGARSFRRGRGAIEGCPPGLAKKDNGCMPPGLAARAGANRALAGAAGISLLAATYSPRWYGYDDYGPDYRYYDGYLLRTSGDRVLGYVPLLGGALSIGSPWPAYYEPEPLPPYWVDYYDLGPPERYRYYDDVIYEIDPGRSDFEEIVALLTGDPWAVGRPMPIGYDVYNVPYTYRTRYYDGPEDRQHRRFAFVIDQHRGPAGHRHAVGIEGPFRFAELAELRGPAENLSLAGHVSKAGANLRKQRVIVLRTDWLAVGPGPHQVAVRRQQEEVVVAEARAQVPADIAIGPNDVALEHGRLEPLVPGQLGLLLVDRSGAGTLEIVGHQGPLAGAIEFVGIVDRLPERDDDRRGKGKHGESQDGQHQPEPYPAPRFPSDPIPKTVCLCHWEPECQKAVNGELTLP